MLYWTQSPFLIWFIPLSQLPTFCLLLKTCSVVLSLSSFPMHSCHAEGTSSSRSNYLFLPERNSALIFKTAMSVRATSIETIKLYHWRSSSARKAPECLGDKQWGLRLPTSLRFDGTPESLSIVSHGLLWKTIHSSALYFLYLRSKKAVGLWAWMSPWSLSLTHVSKWCLVPGISLGCNLERISRQNREKVLARISLHRFTCVRVPPQARAQARAPAELGGEQCRAMKQEKRSHPCWYKDLDTWFRKWVPFVYKIWQEISCFRGKT